MKRKTTKANLFMLGIILAFPIFSFLLGVIQSFISVPLWFLLMAGELSILICILLYFLFARKNIREVFPLSKMKVSTILWAILLSICIMPVVTILNLLSQFFTENVVSSAMSEVYNLPFWVLFAVIGLMPPVIEEIAFRGILLQNYRKNGVLKAILLSGFLFGLMHGNLNQFIYAMFLGVIMAFMVEATGNILSASLLHLIINGSNVLMLGVSSLVSGSSLGDLYEQQAIQMETIGKEVVLMSSLMIYIPMGIVGGIAAFFVFRQMSRSAGRWEYIKAIVHNRIVLPEKERTVDVWLILAVVIGLGTLILNEFAIQIMV